VANTDKKGSGRTSTFRCDSVLRAYKIMFNEWVKTRVDVKKSRPVAISKLTGAPITYWAKTYRSSPKPIKRAKVVAKNTHVSALLPFIVKNCLGLTYKHHTRHQIVTGVCAHNPSVEAPLSSHHRFQQLLG
jgi:hypothetical protein